MSDLLKKLSYTQVEWIRIVDWLICEYGTYYENNIPMNHVSTSYKVNLQTWLLEEV